MALQHSLGDRLRPWHGLMLATFLAGALLSRFGLVGDGGSPMVAVLTGLFAVVLLQFTVGNVWGYAVEYANAGGSWTDLPFLVPFGAGLLATGTVVVAELPFEPADLATGLWAGFWAFVVVAAVTAIGVWFRTGLAEGRS